MMHHRSKDEALAFVRDARFRWHQRYPLSAGVETPGGNKILWLWKLTDLGDLEGKSFLDIGTTNGGVCFEAERRGARRVVGVDIAGAEQFGFSEIKSFLGSSAEFVQGSIYDLPEVLNERFDIVFFWGVLYHLRHPLLALDNLRKLTNEVAFLETAVSDHDLKRFATLPLSAFHRQDELNKDASNWFEPTVRCVLDWCASSGFDPRLMHSWPKRAERCMVQLRPAAGEPEFARVSRERTLTVNRIER
jgi:tRNA (mo5U34)-methyltransferase